MRFALATCLALSALSFAACGGDDDNDDEGFDTFQACFDDHHGEEGLSVGQAIVVCCLDHPINGVTEVCGADAAACTTYVTANVTSTSATSTEISAACTDYQTQKDM